MPQVAITKVNSAEKKTLPVFGEIARRLEAVERRAFDLFEKRGRELGHELEDWFKAEHELFGLHSAEFAEKEGAYEIGIALPGFDVKDVEVTATPNEVIVHAATEKQNKTQKASVFCTEFDANDLYRRFEVPIGINVDQVTAKLNNGMLQINAPKIAKPKETKAVAA
jgi:HSP20 family molecular chaperone IbpA